MVWSQKSTCLLVIASSNTTVIPQQFASRLTYPSAPWRLLQASNWPQLEFYWGHSFHHQASETFRGERSPFKPILQVKDLVLKQLTLLTYRLCSHPPPPLLSKHHDDTAVLLGYIVYPATVVSLVVWARMKGLMGVMSLCVLLLLRAVAAVGVRKCMLVCQYWQSEFWSKAEDKDTALSHVSTAISPFTYMQGCTVTSYITTSSVVVLAIFLPIVESN